MQVLKLLRTQRNPDESSEAQTALSVTILSPYSRQVKHITKRLENEPNLKKGTDVHTIDGFQGREADIIIFTTVRSNASAEIGFLEDERRLNVALTRAKLGRIVVGNEHTLCTGTEVKEEGQEPELRKSSELWGRAIKDCRRVELPDPE